MPRGLDHVVHVVRDLEAAADFYARLGFQVGARNKHPWGTENRLVQLPGFYVELLTIAEPEKIVPQTPTHFSFGAFNRDFLASCGDGFSMLVLESDDAPGDKRALDAAGFGGFELFEFSRKGRRPDGGEIEVAFAIAFARDPASRHAGFFTCRQRWPERFWSPELQRHANGAIAISSCVLAAENPTDHHIFLEALAGVRDVHSSSRGISIATPRGVIQVFDPRAFRDTFGVEPPMDQGLRLSALVFKADELTATGALLERNAIEYSSHHGRLVVGPKAAHGAVIAFEAS
jgi:catechol 2,3-dioxygenase-like lactoylglutathione lyase family enzyme